MRSPSNKAPKDPVEQLLARMPKDQQNSFSAPQIAALQAALGGGIRHTIDFRPVVKVPLLPWSFYLVLLVGKNRREMSAREQLLAARTLFTLLICGITILGLFGLLVLYLIKSALGIDIFEDFSFGIWAWFQETFLGR